MHVLEADGGSACDQGLDQASTVAAVNGHAITGGLITALDCDFCIAARKSATFGLNEVPIGIPMPAAYVEIIKCALGDQVGALTTLRGLLYTPSHICPICRCP
jgi:hypothetical protein